MKELLGIIPQYRQRRLPAGCSLGIWRFRLFSHLCAGQSFCRPIFYRLYKAASRLGRDASALGDLAFIRDFLKTNIHSFGKQYSSDELAKRVAHKPLSETAYCQYLKNKYSEIYRFKN